MTVSHLSVLVTPNAIEQIDDFTDTKDDKSGNESIKGSAEYGIAQKCLQDIRRITGHLSIKMCDQRHDNRNQGTKQNQNTQAFEDAREESGSSALPAPCPRDFGNLLSL
jgi:hypothetical protein